MRRLLPLLLMALLLGPAAARADGFTPAQRAEIVQILRDALVHDPSILRDAVTALQADDDRRHAAAAASAIAREKSALLANPADPVAGEYRLEVSSPGIDRPLTRLKDFEAYEGYEARLELDRLVENRKRFKGVLAGVEGENVLIDLEGEEDVTAEIPFAWISDAKLALTDQLMKRGAEARAARLESEQNEEEG